MINEQTRDLAREVLDWWFDNCTMFPEEPEFVTLAKVFANMYIEENNDVDVWGNDSVDRADAYYSKKLGY